MKSSDALELVFQSFSGEKFKTIMSSLGIIIGVAAIVVMLSVGEGLITGVSGAFGDMELNMVQVIPGGFGDVGVGRPMKDAVLDDRDVSILEGVVGVESVSPRYSSFAVVEFRNEERNMMVMAISPSKEPKLASAIETGRFLSESDHSSVVVGYDVANNMFTLPLNPGSHITLTNSLTDISTDFKVVGILKDSEQTSLLEGSPNSQIFMTHPAMKSFTGIKEYSFRPSMSG